MTCRVPIIMIFQSWGLYTSTYLQVPSTDQCWTLERTSTLCPALWQESDLKTTRLSCFCIVQHTFIDIFLKQQRGCKISLMKHFPDYLQKQSDMSEKIAIFRYYVFFSVFLFQSFFRCVCNMGKRKKAQRKVQKRVVPKLAKVFNCPMCGAAESCTCYMYFYMTDGWVWLTIVTERRARQPYRAASVRSPLYLTKSQVFFFFTLIGRKKAWT